MLSMASRNLSCQRPGPARGGRPLDMRRCSTRARGSCWASRPMPKSWAFAHAHCGEDGEAGEASEGDGEAVGWRGMRGRRGGGAWQGRWILANGGQGMGMPSLAKHMRGTVAQACSGWCRAFAWAGLWCRRVAVVAQSHSTLKHGLCAHFGLRSFAAGRCVSSRDRLLGRLALLDGCSLAACGFVLCFSAL